MSDITVVQIFRDLEGRFNLRRLGSGFSFIFLATEDSIELLSEFMRLGLPSVSIAVDEVYVEFCDLSQHIGKNAVAEITDESLRKAGAYVYWSWEEFLAYRPNILNPPGSFFVIEDGSFYPCSEPSPATRHYLEVCSILSVLLSCADHVDRMSETVIDELVYLHRHRLELPVRYSQEVLSEGLDGVSVITSIFQDESHKEQKNSILKEVLCGLLVNVPKSNRLNYILTNFGEFSKRVIENYRLFVSDFSFDDVRKEYEESKREYLSRLNDVFGTVQARMLGIPVSIAVAAVAMSRVVNDITFWTNLLLLVAVFVYAGMMVALIFNQKHTLSAIKSEYGSQMSRFRHHYSDQYEEIESMKRELDSRHDFQVSCLNWFLAMIGLLFLLFFAIFLWNLPWKMILGIG